MKDTLQKVIDARDAMEKAAFEANFLISNNITTAQDLYWQAERRVHKEYGYDYATTCYDFIIGNCSYEEFSLVAVEDEYYIVECAWTDRENDIFTWILRIPYNMDELPDYVAKFEANCIEQAKKKQQEKTAKKEYLDRKQYNKLKEQFDPDSNDKKTTY